MSKKKLYIIIAITAIITIGFFFAAYIISQQGGGAPVGEQKTTLADFLPFGKVSQDKVGSGGDTAAGSVPGDENDALINQKKIRALRQISATPTAGMYPFTRSGKTSVRFVERATGNIFETAMEDMRRDRVSNALIPKTQEVFFGNDGKTAVYRYLKEGDSSVVTFMRNISDTSGVKAGTAAEAVGGAAASLVSGSFLPEGILQVAVSPDTKNMFYLEKTPGFETRSAVGSVLNFQKNTSTHVFQSPFSEWLPVYFDGKTALLQTKASQNVPGFLYSLDIKNGELQKIIGNVNGLTALPSPDLQKILYSESSRGGMTLRLYNKKTNAITEIPSATLPEKCVWSANSADIYCAAPDSLQTAEYPDAWYQGDVSFSDAMWKIDAKTGFITSVFAPESFDAPKMDMTHLTLSQNGDFLFFINKTDSTLWGFDLDF